MPVIGLTRLTMTWMCGWGSSLWLTRTASFFSRPTEAERILRMLN
jgi:hypothetical protein